MVLVEGIKISLESCMLIQEVSQEENRPRDLLTQYYDASVGGNFLFSLSTEDDNCSHVYCTFYDIHLIPFQLDQ